MKFFAFRLALLPFHGYRVCQVRFPVSRSVRPQATLAGVLVPLTVEKLQKIEEKDWHLRPFVRIIAYHKQSSELPGSCRVFLFQAIERMIFQDSIKV
jgi:hypothetical protein